MAILQLALLFMFVAAIVSVAAEKLRVPYQVALVITGLVAGALHLFPPIQVSSEALIGLLILPLLFEGSLHLAPADLRAYGWLICALAIVGTLIAAFAIAGFVLIFWGLPARSALMLGAIAAATDPVSVIALIREARLDSRLGTILEGEAVINDGVAIVLFTLVMSAGNTGFSGAAMRFTWLVGGGALIGIILGVVISSAVGRVQVPQGEPLGSLILAIAAFIVAEALGASGVIAVVLAGIVFGSYGLQRVSEATQETLRSIWDFIAFLANSVLFILIGLEVPGGLLIPHASLIAGVVLTALAVRALTIHLFSAMHTRLLRAIPVSWRHGLVWGGLRGGVAIALLLDLPPLLPGRDIIVAAVYGLIVFTLLVQGLSMRTVMRWAGIDGEAQQGANE